MRRTNSIVDRSAGSHTIPRFDIRRETLDRLAGPAHEELHRCALPRHVRQVLTDYFVGLEADRVRQR